MFYDPSEIFYIPPDAGGSHSHEAREERGDINSSGGTRTGEGQSNQQQWGSGMSKDQAPHCALAI